MTIVYASIDLAKNVFAVHGVDESGKPALVRPSVPRAKLRELIASLPPCAVAMEACTGAHHRARLFAAHGHTVRLIAPKFVAPCRMSGVRGKNDAADAAAICEAVQRLDERIAQYDGHIQAIARDDERARQLMRLAGIGPTTATAMLAMIGNGHEFRCGRQFAAWLGLTPGQYSSGGKTRLGRNTQGRRRVPAHDADPWRQSGAGGGQEQDRQHQPLGHRAGAAARLLEGGGGHRGEERSHGVGHARAWRVVQVARVARTNTAERCCTRRSNRRLPPRDARSVDEQGRTCAGRAC